MGSVLKYSADCSRMDTAWARAREQPCRKSEAI